MQDGSRAKRSAGSGARPRGGRRRAAAMLAAGLMLLACRSSERPGREDESAKLERLKALATEFAGRLTKIRS